LPKYFFLHRTSPKFPWTQEESIRWFFFNYSSSRFTD
jgi:hypothetical protein